MTGLYKTVVLIMLLLGILTCHGEITRPYHASRPYNEEIDEYKTIKLRCETDKTWKNSRVSWYYQPDAGKDTKTDPGLTSSATGTPAYAVNPLKRATGAWKSWVCNTEPPIWC